MFFNQILCHGAQILCFASIESGRFDRELQLLLADRSELVGGWVLWEKITGHNVDSFVCALSGKDRGDQQLERRLKIQLAMCAWINLVQPLDDPLKTFFGLHFFQSALARHSARFSMSMRPKTNGPTPGFLNAGRVSSQAESARSRSNPSP